MPNQLHQPRPLHLKDLDLHEATPYKPLPVSAYFEPSVFTAEHHKLFKQAPQFVGHASYVPDPGDYYALAHENEARVLIRQADGSITLSSNICRHRQAILLRGKGNLGLSNTLVCPLHQWTYSSTGTLLGAPHFEQNPCRHLPQYAIHSWNGLLFTGTHQPLQELADMLIAPELNFANYTLGHIEHHQCHYNWKTFMEVYLEDYHVESSHPGLGKFVDCSHLDWQYGDHYSVQTVGLHPSFDHPNASGTPAYQALHDAVLRHTPNRPEHGAIWMSYYPNIMIEWYPNVLTVSLLQARGLADTLNTVAFFYPQDILDFEPEFCQSQRTAYFETCLEDDDFAQRMDDGRKSLWQRGDNDAGPYQSPLEDGMVHFHNWYRKHMK
jgi:choline monooxygenase